MFRSVLAQVGLKTLSLGWRRVRKLDKDPSVLSVRLYMQKLKVVDCYLVEMAAQIVDQFFLAQKANIASETADEHGSVDYIALTPKFQAVLAELSRQTASLRA